MSKYLEVLENRSHPVLVIEPSPSNHSKYTVPLVPLTCDDFEPFGSVTQAYPDGTSAPKGIRVTRNNSGTTIKLHTTAILTSTYPQANDNYTVATTSISTFVCPLPSPSQVAEDGTFNVHTLERHRYTTQALTPIMVDPLVFGYTASCEARYIVLVAKNGEDGLPALDTLKGFIATGAQGIHYKTAVWHHPILVIDKPMAFQSVKNQIGDGHFSDCEMITYTDKIIKLKLPEENACPSVRQTKKVEEDLSHQMVPSAVLANRLKYN